MRLKFAKGKLYKIKYEKSFNIYYTKLPNGFWRIKTIKRWPDILTNPNVEVKNITHIGNLHRMIQDYLIIRIAGLFDNDTHAASFQNFCPNDSDYLIIKNEPIIKYLIEFRHNFCAHSNLMRMENGQFPETTKILQSNIPEILQKLLKNSW